MEVGMPMNEEFAEARARWKLLSFYQKFEHAVIVVLTALIAILVVLAVWNLALKIFTSIFASGFDPTDYSVFQAVFGMIFTVIIALEFERSLLVIAERDRGVVQVRTVILNALLAIVRKQMIIRYVGNERPAAFCARCCCPGAWRRVLAGARSGRARRRLTMSAWGTGDHQETILIIRRLEKARMEADWDPRRSTRRPSAI